MEMTRYIKIIALLACSAFATATQAVTLSFDCITNNAAGSCAIGESQLFVDVIDVGGGMVLFDFSNTGPAAAVISEVYFDDGSLLAIATIDNSDPLVNFTQGGTPPDLPGGNSITPAFNVTAGFLADASNPEPLWGVGPGESLGITYTLQGTQTYDDVIGELTTGELRIGIHVKAFANGESESFVNNPVPVPAAVWLFGSGLLGLVGFARKRA